MYKRFELKDANGKTKNYATSIRIQDHKTYNQMIVLRSLFASLLSAITSLDISGINDSFSRAIIIKF